MKKAVKLILAVFILAGLAQPAFAESDTEESNMHTPNTTAPIVVVKDYHTGEILYSRNAGDRAIPASMTKSMTAFITYQEIEAGNLELDTLIRVGQEAARFSRSGRASGINLQFTQGEYVTVEILLQLLMIPSDNSSAVVLAEHISGSEEVFVERMNETAESLGMYASFTNAHGGFVHHSDAYSIAILIREFISRYPDILRITAMPTTTTFRGRNFSNTNHLVRGTPMYGVDGFKTGSLRQAGWNHSVTAERDGRRIITVVMRTGSNAARQAQSRILIEFGFAELERREAARLALIERVRVFFRGGVMPLITPPEISDGRLMLPVQSVFAHLGYSVALHGDHGIVMLTGENGDSISLFIDRNIVSINGTTHTLSDVPAENINGHVFISMELLSLITGTTHDWNQETGVVRFESM
jgi:D-alanyl-D-alanine carboxypeptidase